MEVNCLICYTKLGRKVTPGQITKKQELLKIIKKLFNLNKQQVDKLRGSSIKSDLSCSTCFDDLASIGKLDKRIHSLQLKYSKAIRDVEKKLLNSYEQNELNFGGGASKSKGNVRLDIIKGIPGFKSIKDREQETGGCDTADINLDEPNFEAYVPKFNEIIPQELPRPPEPEQVDYFEDNNDNDQYYDDDDDTREDFLTNNNYDDEYFVEEEIEVETTSEPDMKPQFVEELPARPIIVKGSPRTIKTFGKKKKQLPGSPSKSNKANIPPRPTKDEVFDPEFLTVIDKKLKFVWFTDTFKNTTKFNPAIIYHNSRFKKKSSRGPSYEEMYLRWLQNYRNTRAYQRFIKKEKKGFYPDYVDSESEAEEEILEPHVQMEVEKGIKLAILKFTIKLKTTQKKKLEWMENYKYTTEYKNLVKKCKKKFDPYFVDSEDSENDDQALNQNNKVKKVIIYDELSDLSSESEQEPGYDSDSDYEPIFNNVESKETIKAVLEFGEVGESCINNDENNIDDDLSPVTLQTMECYSNRPVVNLGTPVPYRIMNKSISVNDRTIMKYINQESRSLRLRKIRKLKMTPVGPASLQSKSLQIKCKFCPRIFTSKNPKLSLLLHVSKIHNRTNKTFQNRLKIKPKVFCQLCGKDVRDYKLHWQVTHDRTQIFPCIEPNCGKSFYSNKHLVGHTNRIHRINRENLHICVTCGKIFTNIRSCRKHELIHSTDRQKFYCTICPRSFFSQKVLVVHEATHTGIKNFTCHICSKQYFSNSTLKAHLRSAHGDVKYYTNCPLCSKSVRPSNLKGHLKRHSESGKKASPSACFKCDICNKFMTKSGLRRHKKVVHKIGQVPSTE